MSRDHIPEHSLTCHNSSVTCFVIICDVSSWDLYIPVLHYCLFANFLCLLGDDSTVVIPDTPAFLA